METSHYEKEESSEHQVILYVINGEARKGTMQTMRLTWMCKKRVVHILVDSGSTHNFMDTRTTKNLGLTMCAIAPISIMVADGRKL